MFSFEREKRSVRHVRTDYSKIKFWVLIFFLQLIKIEEEELPGGSALRLFILGRAWLSEDLDYRGWIRRKEKKRQGGRLKLSKRLRL